MFGTTGGNRRGVCRAWRHYRRMDAVEEVMRRGGVARISSLRNAGVTAHAIRRAKEAGRIRTIRRGWVASPDADRVLVGAVTRGVLLSCVSGAARLGLWVPEKPKLHVVARPNAARVKMPSHVTVHWSRPVVPRDPDATVDGLANILALVAQCQPRETALVIWESAFNKGVIDRTVLGGFELPPVARALLDDVRPFADSGLETIFIARLRWLGVSMLPQAWVHERRVDVLIGERLVIQIDGASHTGPQRTADIDHDAQLMLRGFHVLRFSYEQIMERWHEVQAVVMDAVAQGRHRA